MKLKLLVWSFFMLCCPALLIMALESTSKHEDFNLSKPVMLGPVHGLNGTIGFYEGHERRDNKDKHEIFQSKKSGHKGKGSYGGANIVHRPPKGRSAAPLSAESPFFVSTTMLYVSLAFILIFPFLR